MPIRYTISGREAAYTKDLNLPDHAMIWRDACLFVMAGNRSLTMEEFWLAAREEYFRSGGAFREENESEIAWEA
jgi:hypothetical protein